MADSVVSFLVETLGSLAIDEVKLLKSVGDEFSEIKDEFSSIQALLKDADAKEDSNETVKEWVKQVRDVAYETEDVLDDFRLLQRQSIGRVWTNMKTRHQLANRIQAIKSKVTGIVSRKDKYGLNNWEQGSTSQALDVQEKRDPRIDALYIKEVQLVGIDKIKEQLVQRLVNENKQTSVISVYGDGGLGKTTLIKKVFDNQVVMAHFQYRAWAFVSESFVVKEVLKDLIGQTLNEDEKNSMRDQIKDMDTSKLIDMLRNRLQGNRYILVFDDIWKSDTWKILKNALPDDMEHGSRIVVTTRFQNIASECISESKYGHKLKLQHLAPKDALKLFCKLAFPSNDSNSCPNHLMKISHKFLHKCKGLPLAIVSIAGLLRTKPTVKWNEVYENLGFLMRSDEKLKDLNSIISLSYTDLPFHLKSCFLYLCIFPEDYSINCKKLLQLWVAEGFVERKLGMSNNVTLEDIAKGYLDELINRSLVQVEVLDDLTGWVKTCRVHDVVREFIIGKAYEQAFVAHYSNKELHGQVIGRRLSVIDDVKNMFTLLKGDETMFSHLRSLISFDPDTALSSFSEVIKRCKLLRVLSVKFNRFDPDAIVPRKHYNLRYLCFMGYDNMLSFPSFITMLTDLEVLDMKGIGIKRSKLPKEILKLKRIRYLYIGCRDPLFSSSIKLPDGIEKLTNLEHLSVIDANVKGSSKMLKSLGMLTRMRKLVITGLKEEDGKHLCASIEKMEKLRSLVIMSETGKIDVDNLTSPPQYLEKLELKGELLNRSTPRWLPKLQNVIKLTLTRAHITDGCLLKSVQELPSLVELELFLGFDQEELYFENGGFPKLKKLAISLLLSLRKMTVEEGALPCIEKLHFFMCLELKEAPLGIKYLATLKTIDIFRMPTSFENQIRKQVWKAGHTPVILYR